MAQNEIEIVAQFRDQASRNIEGLNRSMTNMGRQTDEVASRAERGFGKVEAAVAGAAAGIANQLAGRALNTLQQEFSNTINASLDWESSLAGISKTLDDTGLSAGEAEQAVADIGDELRQMAKETPVAVTELAGVAEAAGQLGIAREDVVDFTQVMAELGSTTDLSSQEAATAIARIANITGLATEDIGNFGASLTALGNSSAATESEILNMATRIAASGTQANMSEGEILGLSAALTSVGVRAEAGGTSVVTVMDAITTAVATSSEELDVFAEIAGTTAEQFAAQWRDNPSLALTEFVEGLNEVQQSGGDTVLILDQLGLDGIRVSQALNSLAGAGDLVRESTERGNRAFEDGTALQEEFAKRVETTASQIEIARNRIQDARIEIGDHLTPILADAAEGAADFAESIALFVGENREDIEKFAEAVSGAAGSFADLATEAGKATVKLAELVNVGSDSGDESFIGAMAGDIEDIGNQADRLSRIISGEGLTKREWEEFLGGPDLFNDFTMFWMDTVGQVSESATRDVVGIRNAIEEMTDTTIISLQHWEQQHGISFANVEGVYDHFKETVDESKTVIHEYQVEMREMQIAADEGADRIDAAADAQEQWILSTLEAVNAAEVASQGYDRMAVEAGLAEQALSDLHAVNALMQQGIDDASSAIGHWESRLGEAQRAQELLKEQLDAGNISQQEYGERLETLTGFEERLAEGIENDLVPAFISQVEAAAELQEDLDNLNQALADGEISQSEYAEKAGELRQAFEEQTNPIGVLIDKIGDLVDALLGLDETEANPQINLIESTARGAGGGGRGGQNRFEQRAEDLGLTGNVKDVGNALDELDGSEATVTATLQDEASDGLESIDTRIAGLDGTGFTVTANVDIGPALAAIDTLDRNMPHSPAEEGPLSQLPNWDALFEDIAPALEARLIEAREEMQEFLDDVQESWDDAFRTIEREFVNDPVSILTGGGKEQLQEDIAAYEAYLEALVEAGFGPGSKPYQEAVDAYLQLQRELAVISAIGGTDAAEEFMETFVTGIEDIPIEPVMEGILERAVDAVKDFNFADEIGGILEDVEEAAGGDTGDGTSGDGGGAPVSDGGGGSVIPVMGGGGADPGGLMDFLMGDLFNLSLAEAQQVFLAAMQQQSAQITPDFIQSVLGSDSGTANTSSFVGMQSGGLVGGDGLAMLHRNEVVVSPSADALRPLADAIVEQMQRQRFGRGGPTIQVDANGADAQEIAEVVRFTLRSMGSDAALVGQL